MSAARDECRPVGEFLEWLGDQGMAVCTLLDRVDDDGAIEEWFAPIGDSIEQLLVRWQNIDLDKVEDERRALLEAIRS